MAVEMLQFVPNVKRVTIAHMDLGIHVRLVNTVMQALQFVNNVLMVTPVKTEQKLTVGLDFFQLIMNVRNVGIIIIVLQVQPMLDVQMERTTQIMLDYLLPVNVRCVQLVVIAH